MELVSVNVGMPRLLTSKGASFKTGIFKHPVAGRVMLRQTNLDGDRQADLSVHGGANKAVYAYPSEHYGYWRGELSLEELPWGAFGENFTTDGLLESHVSMGDQYRVGSAVIRVTTPRLPCYKLAAKFKSDDIIEQFLRSGRSGFYFSRRPWWNCSGTRAFAPTWCTVTTGRRLSSRCRSAIADKREGRSLT